MKAVGCHRALVGLAVGTAAALLPSPPASASGLCDLSAATCVPERTVADFVQFRSVQNEHAGLTGVCAIGPAPASNEGAKFTLAGSVVAEREPQLVAAENTTITCRVYVDQRLYGEASGWAPASAAASAGVTSSIPFHIAGSWLLCVRATAHYPDEQEWRLYSTDTGCPVGW